MNFMNSKNLYSWLLIALFTAFGSSLDAQAQELSSSSNVKEMLNYVTNSKNQQGRNTCTVFALTAALETLYILNYGDKYIDFSEEWVQYLAAGSRANASGGARGSMVSTNFNEIKAHGITTEQKMPYTAGKWTLAPDDSNARKVREFCGHLSGLQQTRCLHGKRSPQYMRMSDSQLRSLSGGVQFSNARAETARFDQFVSSLRFSRITSETEIKRALLRKVPLTVELNVFYGSWNNASATKYGIDINAGLYRKGVVTYPDKGSVDRTVSPQHLARHAVQIIGYDDNVKVRYSRKMNDGRVLTFERTGVYYFKNSWSSKFGNRFQLGRSRYPGFGMITQDYVHHFGKITAVSLKK